MRVLWLAAARNDLRELVAYLDDRNPSAARRTSAAIIEHVRALAEQSGLGRPGRVPGTRELVIPRTPYIVAYTVDLRAEAVVVLRVLHSARLWPEAL